MYVFYRTHFSPFFICRKATLYQFLLSVFSVSSFGSVKVEFFYRAIETNILYNNGIQEIYMQLFQSYTFTWWQIGIFKLALISIGVAIGAYWNDFFIRYLIALIVIAVITSAYIAYISLKQSDLNN